ASTLLRLLQRSLYGALCLTGQSGVTDRRRLNIFFWTAGMYAKTYILPVNPLAAEPAGSELTIRKLWMNCLDSPRALQGKMTMSVRFMRRLWEKERKIYDLSYNV